MTAKAKLTEAAAWAVIEKWFRTKRSQRDGRSGYGLCYAASKLFQLNLISYEVYDKMRDRIDAECRRRDRYSSYLWTCVPSNRIRRARLAKKFAKECRSV